MNNKYNKANDYFYQGYTKLIKNNFGYYMSNGRETILIDADIYIYLNN